jgi:hypothetical protein
MLPDLRYYLNLINGGMDTNWITPNMIIGTPSHKLLRQRIHRMPPPDRRVIEAGAVIIPLQLCFSPHPNPPPPGGGNAGFTILIILPQFYLLTDRFVTLFRFNIDKSQIPINISKSPNHPIPQSANPQIFSGCHQPAVFVIILAQPGACRVVKIVYSLVVLKFYFGWQIPPPHPLTPIAVKLRDFFETRLLTV